MAEKTETPLPNTVPEIAPTSTGVDRFFTRPRARWLFDKAQDIIALVNEPEPQWYIPEASEEERAAYKSKMQKYWRKHELWFCETFAVNPEH